MSLAYRHGRRGGELHHAYRAKAIRRLREWFCTPATRMNPRLLFGSVVTNKVSPDLGETEFEKVRADARTA